MTRRISSPWPRRIVNLFAALAYVLVALQWLFVAVVYFPLLVSLFSEPATPEPGRTAVEPLFTAPPEGSVLSFFIIAAVLVVMVGLTAYLLVKLPATIARTGRKTVKAGAKVVTHTYAKATRQRDTKKLQLKLGPQVAVLIKFFLMAVPVGLAYGTYLMADPSLSPALSVYLSAFMAQFILLLFVAQYGLARVFDVDVHDLW